MALSDLEGSRSSAERAKPGRPWRDRESLIRVGCLLPYFFSNPTFGRFPPRWRKYSDDIVPADCACDGGMFDLTAKTCFSANSVNRGALTRYRRHRFSCMPCPRFCIMETGNGRRVRTLRDAESISYGASTWTRNSSPTSGTILNSEKKLGYQLKWYCPDATVAPGRSRAA